MAYEPQGPSNTPEISALAEVALCENLAQTSGWAAKWSAQVAEADGAILWAPDAVHPVFLCIAAEGEGTRPFLKRSASRDTGVVHDLIRDERPITIERKDFSPQARGPAQGVPGELPLGAGGSLERTAAGGFSDDQAPPQRLRLDPPHIPVFCGPGAGGGRVLGAGREPPTRSLI
jgi:hypothetical protein